MSIFMRFFVRADTLEEGMTDLEVKTVLWNPFYKPQGYSMFLSFLGSAPMSASPLHLPIFHKEVASLVQKVMNQHNESMLADGKFDMVLEKDVGYWQQDILDYTGK